MTGVYRADLHTEASLHRISQLWESGIAAVKQVLNEVILDNGWMIRQLLLSAQIAIVCFARIFTVIFDNSVFSQYRYFTFTSSTFYLWNFLG